MKLQDTRLIDIIPEYMRDDRTIKGFSHAWQYLWDMAVTAAGMVDLFNHLDDLESDQLDQVADAMGIPWYDTSFDDIQKAETIRHYEQNCFELGTKAAIKRVMDDIYDNVVVMAWHEYGGQPFHFKVSVSAPDEEVTLERVARVVRAAKTAKATLDSVETSERIEATLRYKGLQRVIYTYASIPAAKMKIEKEAEIRSALYTGGVPAGHLQTYTIKAGGA